MKRMIRAVGVLRRALNRGRYVFVAIIATHIVGGTLFTLVENTYLDETKKKSFGDGQWWATVTGFTVGYGDLYPVSEPGRVIAQIYIILMAILWLFAGAHVIAAIIEDKNLFTHDEQERNEAFYLEMGQKLGIIPAEFTKLPPLEWFQKTHNFQPDPD
jgi:voltage-gated potassium channel